MNAFKANPPFRIANFEDVVFIARLLREFYAKRHAIYGIPYDHESMIVTVDDVIRHGLCLVGPTSCAGATVDLFPSNCEAAVACVKFWYFKNHREIFIFDEIRRFCKHEGAGYLDASSHFPDNTIGKFYRKKGMSPAETVFIGKL